MSAPRRVSLKKHDHFPLMGKVAIITGGGSKLGVALAKHLYAKGLKALSIADHAEKGPYVDNELKLQKDKKGLLFVATDISNLQEFDDLFHKTVQKFKFVDILINNASVFDELNWEQEIAINLNGTVNGNVLGVENYLSKFNSSGKAVIINISSAYGINGMPGAPIYSGISAAITQLTRTFGHANNYARTGVRVVCICQCVSKITKPEKLSPISFLNESLYKSYVEATKTQPLFETECMINSVIDKIESAESGSVWYSRNGHVYEEYPIPSF